MKDEPTIQPIVLTSFFHQYGLNNRTTGYSKREAVCLWAC